MSNRDTGTRAVRRQRQCPATVEFLAEQPGCNRSTVCKVRDERYGVPIVYEDWIINHRYSSSERARCDDANGPRWTRTTYLRGSCPPDQAVAALLRGVSSYHLSTRMARRVFQRLGLRSPSSSAKCMRPGCVFSRDQRPAPSRLDSTRWIASAIRSSGGASAPRM